MTSGPYGDDIGLEGTEVPLTPPSSLEPAYDGAAAEAESAGADADAGGPANSDSGD